MKQLNILATILFAFLTACQGRNNQIVDSVSSVANTSFIPTDSSQFYFPIGKFSDSEMFQGRDTFVNTWYSQHLFAMREPVVYMDKSQNEIYRFTWLRTFDNPVAIRIEKHGNSHLLFWKLCDGAGGYEPGQLTINKQKTIQKETWEEFKKHLDQINFWNLETNETRLLGTDGSRWILEGKTVNNYHVVDRWTPNQKSKYYKSCYFLVGLTDLKIEDGSNY